MIDPIPADKPMTEEITPDTPITVDGVTMTARDAASFVAEGCANGADRIARYLADPWYAAVNANAVADFRAMGDSITAHKRANAAYAVLKEYHRRLAQSQAAELADLRGKLAAAEGERDAATTAIRGAIDYANNRQSEWGSRAIASFEILETFLASLTPEASHGK